MDDHRVRGFQVVDSPKNATSYRKIDEEDYRDKYHPAHQSVARPFSRTEPFDGPDTQTHESRKDRDETEAERDDSSNLKPFPASHEPQKEYREPNRKRSDATNQRDIQA